MQSYEDEDQEDEDDDEDAEPRMWTRVRSLLLCLYLQMYHRFQQLMERADSVLEFLGEAADVVGLSSDYLQPSQKTDHYPLPKPWSWRAPYTF